MKIFTFVILLLVCLGGIGFIFWQQELQFIGPTPIPNGYVNVAKGDSVNLAALKLPEDKPLFIHYYNYHCPCSRFNAKEFGLLVKTYGDKVNFIAIVQTADNDDEKVVEAFKEKYDLGIPVVQDKNGTHAKALGVYSTPQATIIKDKKVFYRGNYNKARFCTTKNTKFAEIALNALLNDEPPPYFPLIAEVAYGCELPSNGNHKQRFFDLF